MDKNQLITELEQELTVTIESIKWNIKHNELYTAIKHQQHERSIRWVLDKVKLLK